MQNNQFPHFSDEVGDRNMHVPYASASSFDALFPPCAKLPYHGVELQPSAVCPKNFVIFDQTYDRSQVMYHPDMSHRLMNNPSLNTLASTFQNEYVGESYGHSYGNYDQEVSSSHQEDPNEIDALLSADEDYEDDDDEGNEDGDSEEVSSARYSSREYGNNSAESSCSSYGYNNTNNNYSRKPSLSGSASSNNGGKGRKKMKKMMGVLRRIVPGGEQMNTANVLDEAVQYLKSLKIEAQKLGVGHYSNQS